MGNGSEVLDNYKLKQPYYCGKDFDEKLGGDFWFLIEPLHGWTDEERFFFVTELENGKYEFTGEGYIVSGKRPTERLAKFREELKDTNIEYLFLGDDGEIVRRESASKYICKSAEGRINMDMVLFVVHFENEDMLFFQGTRVPETSECQVFCDNNRAYIEEHFGYNYHDLGDVEEGGVITRERANEFWLLSIMRHKTIGQSSRQQYRLQLVCVILLV